MSSKKPTGPVRDARTGQYVKRSEATRRPSTTVTESPNKKSGKR